MKELTSNNNNNTNDSSSTIDSPLKLHLSKQSNAPSPTKEEQEKFAKSYLNKTLKLGDKWYLINSDWYSKWAIYVGISLNDNDDIFNKNSNFTSVGSPSKINNKTLLENGNLRTDITEEIDYYTVPQELWEYLVQIYSITQDEDIIERYVIDDGTENDPSYKIELRRLRVNLTASTDKTNIVVEEMSRSTSLDQVVNRIKTLFKVPEDRQVKLYFKASEHKMIPLEISNNVSLNTSGYSFNDTIYLEVQEEDGSWPINSKLNSSSSSIIKTDSAMSNSISIPQPPPPPMSSPKFSSPSTSSSSSLVHSNYLSSTRQASSSFSNRHSDYKPGLCGLSNLGNTCFMNSAIQCMSNVPLLTDYFRSHKYKSEINKVNPLGRKGEIAEAYADLIDEMWSGSNSYTIPRNFKLHLGRFAPQFTGFQQQDSHELLAFLLDGLHEDLNRIMKKPYIELGSHVGKTDEVFAEESWQDHKKRNDSIIVDIFHGLLKSTLNCLVCQEISIKFDPFCYLSVPLPSKKERLIEIFFVPLDAAQPITKYKLSVLKNGTIQDLCTSLEALIPTVSKSNMVVCDVYTCKFFKIYESNESVNNIRERDDIYIYEISSNLNNNQYLKAKVLLKEKSNFSYSSSYFGLPLFISVPKANLTYGLLYDYIFQSLKRFLKDTTNPSEEINSKLNNSLTVNDEDYQEQNNSGNIYDKNNDDKLDESNSDDATPSRDVNSSFSKNSKSNEQKSSNNGNTTTTTKIFNLVVCKNDNVDYEGYHQSALSDDTPFDWQNVNSKDATISYNQSNNQIITIIADFGQNFQKKFYNKKPYEEPFEHSSCNSQLVKKKDVISLSDCFNLYTKIEELSEQDYWYCSKCKSHQPSTKKFDIWSLPPVLVVHLKRFSYGRLYRDKIDTLVEFPLTDLDMSSYLIHKNNPLTSKYNLIAVSNHYGSLGGGHYTAYGQNRSDGRWYYFDDSSVTSSDESSVCTNAAYLLIYLRQDIHNECLNQGGENVVSNGSTNKTRLNNSLSERMDH